MVGVGRSRLKFITITFFNLVRRGGGCLLFPTMKMMAPPTTATTDSRLRLRGYYHNHRALHGEQQSLFDNPGSSQIDDTFNQNSQQQPPLSLQRHSASWGTYASFFLLTQGIAIICFIGILIFCIRKHRHQMTRQRIASMAQSQGWVTMTTIRSSATPTAASAGEIGSGGQTSGNERADNDARDTTSGLGAGDNTDNSSSLTTGDFQICPYPPNNGVNDDRSENQPTPFDRFLTMSRTIGSTMLHPLRALRAAINNWATGSYDEVFLRQLMERMEAEREAAKENPNERARRLKEAFAKAGTVWELGDEHFTPPTRIGEGFASSNPIPNGTKLDIEEGMKAEEVNEICCEASLVDEIDENDVPDVQTRDKQLGISPRHREATEMNSNLDCLESSIDSLEPNQRYIYLPMNAESTECIPVIVHDSQSMCNLPLRLRDG
ncbi:hypothetical protein ACHAWU_005200 [Discostella pseudostelligera]|uniref:Uncharacterized protein n=1 Tax=Discostella pseudostelligera TaxID=259834 RepID=A0ABD3MDX7_9STRA